MFIWITLYHNKTYVTRLQLMGKNAIVLFKNCSRHLFLCKNVFQFMLSDKLFKYFKPFNLILNNISFLFVYEIFPVFLQKDISIANFFPCIFISK